MISVDGTSHFNAPKHERVFKVTVTLNAGESDLFARIGKEFGKSYDADVYILKLIIDKGLTELGLEASQDDYFRANVEEMAKEVEFTSSERGAGRKLFEERQDWIEAYDRMMSSAAKIIAIERGRK